MVPSRVCVAMDLSQSMDVADVQRSADEADELARALGGSPTEVAGWSRKEIARRILSSAGIDLLRRLGRQHQVELVAFHETRWDVDPAALDALFSGGNTSHATDLRQALRPGGTAGSAPLHGILVLTDGRHNRGPLPLSLAQQLGIPIYPVAIGSKRPPPDLLVLDVQAPDKVFKDTTLPVTARLKAMHLPAQELTVELQVPGKAVRPEDRHKIKHPGGDAVYDVKFQVPMNQAGTHALKVHATASQGGEITLENNQRSHVVRVVEDKARVLLIDEEARWEYYYLAGAAARSDGAARSCSLRAAAPRARQARRAGASRAAAIAAAGAGRRRYAARFRLHHSRRRRPGPAAVDRPRALASLRRGARRDADPGRGQTVLAARLYEPAGSRDRSAGEDAADPRRARLRIEGRLHAAIDRGRQASAVPAARSGRRRRGLA